MKILKISLTLLCLILFCSSAGLTQVPTLGGQAPDLIKKWEKRIKGGQVRVATGMVLACQTKLRVVSATEAAVIQTFLGATTVIQADDGRTFLAQRIIVPGPKEKPAKVDTYKFADLKEDTTQYGAATQVVANIFTDSRIMGALKGKRAPAKSAGTESSCSKSLAVECKVPDEIINPVKELLKISGDGQEILKFLEQNKIPFQYDDSTESFTIDKEGCHFASTLAYWAPINRFIGLNREINVIPPAELASLIAHEGFHGMWNLHNMASRSIEEEEDATFLQYVTYHEILRARPELRAAKENVTETYYRTKFIPWIKEGNLDAFNQDVDQNYSGYENYKTLSQMLNNPKNSEEEKKKLDLAQKMHANQHLMEQQWIKDHQKEF